MIGWEPVLDAPHTDDDGLPPFAVEQPPPAKRAAREVPVLLVTAAVIAFLIKSLVAQAFYIPSESMVPQLQVNDRVVVSRIAYHLHDPRRGDIVVFDDPRPGSTSIGGGGGSNVITRFVRGLGEAVGVVQPSTEEFIKRVIGLPGETVEAKAGRVYVNGRLLYEPYLPNGTITTDFPPVVVPAGSLWVMGDNRGNSSDSRFFGPVRRSTVVGRTILRVWPPGSASFL
ncbi:MAG: signal peptidase [Actinomycetota bacterium]|nr:signal peptidase [Actinomycetota bacterium]